MENISSPQPVYSYTPQCPVCHKLLELRLAKGRRSKKPFIMLICPGDGRHIRAFLNDAEYVRKVLARMEKTT